MGSPAVEEETPAIKALGSLFKLTEIYLSDDTSYEVHRCLASTEATRAIHEDAVDSNINSEFDFLPEDMELAKLMSGMGLPMSFHTKQRNGTLGGKRKQKKKHTVPTQDGVQEPIEERVGGYASSTILHKTSESLSCLLTGRESELSTFNNAASVDEVCHIPARVKDSISSTSSSAKSTIYEFIPSDLGQDQELNSKSTCHDILLREDIGVMEHLSLDRIVGAVCDSKDLTGDHMESICVESTLAVNHGGRSVFGDWKVYWDNFYSRNYFYNLISQECTWDPPPGMEELVFINIKDKATEPENDIANLDVTLAGFEEPADQLLSCGAQPTLDLSKEHKGDIGLLDQQLHDSIGDKFECTWDPPPEIEEVVFINIADKATKPENDIANLDVTLAGFEESADQFLSCGAQPTLDLSEEHIKDIGLLDQQLHNSIGDELECTWDPPPEIEELVFINIADKATEPENDIANLDVTLAGFEEPADQLLSCGAQPTLDLSEEHKGDIGLLDQQLHDSIGDKFECTWDPPPEIEEVVFINIADKATKPENDIANLDVTLAGFEESADQFLSCGAQPTLDLSEEHIKDIRLLDQQLHNSIGDELECTWDPPPEIEELVFINIADKATEPENDIANLDVTLAGFEEPADQLLSCGAQPTLDLSEEHKGDIGLLDQQHHDSIGDELECTWDPPPEIEELVFIDIIDKATEPENDIANLDVTLYGFEESADQLLSCGTQPILVLSEEHKGDVGLLDQQLHDSVGDELVDDISCHISSAKRKKKSRRVKSKQNLSIGSGEFQFPSIIEGFYPSLSKYWCQRYRLFSKYDEGIQMDEEGWFSVTPESIAKHHAHRCANGTIVDFFAGVGGNAIQFAQRCRHVIAIDIDPKKIDYAQHNAAIYGVSDQIDFIRGDSLTLAPMLKVNVVFMSPPWGGPDYAKVKTFDIKTMLKPHDGRFLFNIATGIAPKVVMFLPKNVDINQLAELALSTNPPWSLEVEKNFLNGKLKAITAYYIKSSS